MKRKLVIIVALAIVWYGCGEKKIKTGAWRGIIYTQEQQIPFNFELQPQSDHLYQVILKNGDERFSIDSVVVRGDSIHIPVLLFDAYIKAYIEKGRMVGHWVKPYAVDYRLPFEATFDNDFRFRTKQEPTVDVSGKWEVEFTDNKGTSPAIGIFEQKGSKVTGSFLTNHGDYRYLEGVVDGDSLFLSLFDGTNAYLFKAKTSDTDILTGDFYSGITGHKQWTAKRNESAVLTDPTQLTFMKEGYERVDFDFIDMEGRNVSLSDDRFEDKIVIVQILGSWCVNCMDETKFLAEWYRNNQEKPVEIIGLAFERKDDYDYAKKQLGRFINRFDVRYPILFAGVNNRENLQKALPMIERISAFPTTIYLDKQKKVRKIHRGFSGPGTGVYFEEFVKEFNDFVESLLAE